MNFMFEIFRIVSFADNHLFSHDFPQCASNLLEQICLVVSLNSDRKLYSV